MSDDEYADKLILEKRLRSFGRYPGLIKNQRPSVRGMREINEFHLFLFRFFFIITCSPTRGSFGDVIYGKRYSRNLVFKRPFFIFKPYLKKKTPKPGHVSRAARKTREMGPSTLVPSFFLIFSPSPFFFFLIYVPDIRTGIP